MKVLFGVVVCVLISSQRIASVTVANSNSSSSHITLPGFLNYSTASSVNLTTSPRPSTSQSILTTIQPSTLTTEPYPVCKNPLPPKHKLNLVHKTSVDTLWNTVQKDAGCIPEHLFAYCVALKEDNLWGWSWIKKKSEKNVTVNGNYTFTNLSITNLSEFTNYTCNVTLIFSGTEVASITQIKIQTDRGVPTDPKDVRITDVKSTSFVIMWEPPEKNPDNFIEYYIDIIDLGAQHPIPYGCDHNTTNHSTYTENRRYEFLNASPHHKYNINVWAKNKAGKSNASSTFVVTNTSASLEPEEVTIAGLEPDNLLNQTSANFTWRMPCQTNGPITTFNINLTGLYIPNASVKDFRTFIVNASDNVEYFIIIHDIVPASAYTFTVRADGYYEIGYSHNYNFSTGDDVPGPPIIDEITDIGYDYIFISWSEPKINAGYIVSYNVTVTSLRPLYEYDQSRCLINNETYSKGLINTTTYNITELNPYYEYEIGIVAFTSKGGGNASTVVAKTTGYVPDEPAEFNFRLIENTTGVLQWKSPCNANGPTGNFIVLISGTYTDNSSIVINPDEKLVEYINASVTYKYEVQLEEAFDYNFEVWMVSNFTRGYSATNNFTTPDGYPGVPNNVTFLEVTANSFIIEWEPPTNRAGRIQWYRVTVSPLGPVYPTRCNMNHTETIYERNGSDFRSEQFLSGLPYYNYTVSIQANTTRGFGNATEDFIVTNQSVPDNVELPPTPIFSDPEPDTTSYDIIATISFKEPCFLNGDLLYYELNAIGMRQNFDDHVLQPQKSKQHNFEIILKPDYNYTYTVTTFNTFGSNISDVQLFRSPAGVPTFTVNPKDFPVDMGPDIATITLSKDYFDEANGDIQYFALYLTDKNVTGGYFNDWNGHDWPSVNVPGTNMYIQITENYWNPFKDQNNITLNIGTEVNYGNNCSITLEKNREYYLIIRLFTNNFFRNSATIRFRIGDVGKLGLILGVIFGLLVAAVIGLAGFFAWRKNMLKLPPIFLQPRKSSCCNSTQSTAFTAQKFPQYCKYLENNPEKLTEQYTLLAERTKEAIRMHTTHYAELTENRRKNRYTNILPYDETRVKLLIDEDDEIGSDYINASYIKGYSGEVEYIATQGPLPTTCRDFWKMVIQENVSIIVMVTQFIEQNKEKCYKYFPNNHESMIVGEDIEVRCSMELHFGTYCVRTIQVKKDVTQVAVTHMQYLDWPDFNVPKGTETMLQFCRQLRDRLNMEGGCVIVHCSAGVGRTGTLIATDILRQNVNAGKNIDIFNTVLELRKQRTNMVQTQKQYMYIYNLIKDFLEHSQTPGFDEGMEHLYENVSVLKMKQDDDNLIAKEKQTESQF